jgi:hypothetical protein
MAEERELDVDLDVVEQPEQGNFGRRPNVVCRRGHRLKFNVGINDVPTGTTFVTINAKVFTYGPEYLGPEAHASRSRKLWGMEPGRAFEIDPENLPVSFDLVVSKRGGDDHLGQGPYEAIITVNPSSEEPKDSGAVTEGDEFSIEFVSM